MTRAERDARDQRREHDGRLRRMWYIIRTGDTSMVGYLRWSGEAWRRYAASPRRDHQSFNQFIGLSQPINWRAAYRKDQDGMKKDHVEALRRIAADVQYTPSQADFDGLGKVLGSLEKMLEAEEDVYFFEMHLHRHPLAVVTYALGVGIAELARRAKEAGDD